MIIRPECPDDYKTLLQLTYRAFTMLEYPGRRRMDEHYLIYLLKDSPYIIPELCFVAEQDGEIIGHILYTKSKINRPDGTALDTITFGPLSVLPEYQRQGIGASLVRHSIEKAQELGFGAILITGVPDYYPKLGFSRARDYGLTPPDGSADNSFMVYELTPGYLSGGGTLHFLPPEFDKAENDDTGFEAFHKEFMTSFYSSQLMLRPLFDGDISLMERWLYTPHVAEWYKYPDYLRRGFGKEMIAQMLNLLRETGARTVIAEPERSNTASNRALEANGFIWNGTDYYLVLKET